MCFSISLDFSFISEYSLFTVSSFVKCCWSLVGLSQAYFTMPSYVFIYQEDSRPGPRTVRYLVMNFHPKYLSLSTLKKTINIRPHFTPTSNISTMFASEFHPCRSSSVGVQILNVELFILYFAVPQLKMLKTVFVNVS